jgi:hypothetical protein
MAAVNHAFSPAFVATVTSKRNHVAARYIALDIFEGIAGNWDAAVMRNAATVTNHIIGLRLPMLRNLCKVTIGVAVVLVGHNLFFSVGVCFYGVGNKLKILLGI